VRLLPALAVVLAVSRAGVAAEFEIQRAEKELKLLRIVDQDSRLRSEKDEDGKSVPVLDVRGNVPRDSSLMVGDRKIPLDEPKEGIEEIPFSVPVRLTSEETKSRWLVVDPYGKAKTETLKITFPSYAEWTEDANTRFIDRVHATPSLGFTSVSYKQDPVSSIAQPGTDATQLGLTAKAYATYELTRRPERGAWQLGAGGFFTLFPLSVTPSSEFEMRFLGINARVGYLRALPDGWEVALHGGFYYLTMFTSGTFGVVNLGGPQLYPTVKKNLGATDSLQAYFKLSPISDGLGVQSLSNRELALGLSWSHLLGNGHPLVVGLDVSSVKLMYLDKFDVRMSSLSLGCGYGF
jgi:hypothetical protein